MASAKTATLTFRIEPELTAQRHFTEPCGTDVEGDS